MKTFSALSIAFYILTSVDCLLTHSAPTAHFYDDARNENFNDNELELLEPFIHVLQTQFNQISDKVDYNERHDSIIDSQLIDLLPMFVETDDFFALVFEYNISLPTITDLRGIFTKGLSSDEAEDIENMLQESIDEASEAIQELISQSEEIEERLFSINKIKIVKFIYKIVGKVYALGVKAGRTAYCTYSSIPALNSTLTEGKNNIGSCYKYTKTAVSKLRYDVQTAINDIRANVLELVDIYKKIANRKSLLGKLFTILMNVPNIRRDIIETRSAATETLKEFKNDVPVIITNTKECTTYAIPRFVNQLNETLTWLATCLAFEDDSTQGPEPEPESDEDSSELV